MRVFVLGYPGDLGGANTECWHTVKLWRRFGLQVTLLPYDRPDPRWRQRLDAIGAETFLRPTSARWDRRAHPAALPGATVVAFCNLKFLAEASYFRALGCRVVWVGCMNFIFPLERLHYRRHGVFDRYVFQSDFQRSQLEPQLRKFGYEDSQGHLIRGVFDCGELSFQPRPHRRSEPFTVGRLARPALDKHSRNTWLTYGRVLHPIRARVMGWSAEIEAALGRPPAWAEALPPRAEPADQFLASLHVLAPINGGAVENWPRAGLEAMAAGVPIVAENRGGWPEMIRPGVTGYLADTPDEMAYYISRLAYDEPHRLALAHEARRVLETELAESVRLWAKWHALLRPLG